MGMKIEHCLYGRRAVCCVDGKLVCKAVHWKGPLAINDVCNGRRALDVLNCAQEDGVLSSARARDARAGFEEGCRTGVWMGYRR